jgi:hypothetical protein
MSVPDEFREKARKCFERAKCAPDSEYQKLFRDLAVQWLALAVEADASEPPELPSGDQGTAASKSGGSAGRSLGGKQRAFMISVPLFPNPPLGR